jgi:peptidoglycan/LPS O-acetylase OafA/YrhL
LIIENISWTILTLHNPGICPNKDSNNGMNHPWSLGVEERFYFISPAIICKNLLEMT